MTLESLNMDLNLITDYIFHKMKYINLMTNSVTSGTLDCVYVNYTYVNPYSVDEEGTEKRGGHLLVNKNDLIKYIRGRKLKKLK